MCLFVVAIVISVPIIMCPSPTRKQIKAGEHRRIL